MSVVHIEANSTLVFMALLYCSTREHGHQLVQDFPEIKSTFSQPNIFPLAWFEI